MKVPRGPFWSNKTTLQQYGLVTLAQSGLSPSAMSKCVQRGEVERVLPGVYRSPLVPRSLHQTVLAAVLWAGDSAVASHFSAARLYGLDLPHGQPHVLVPPARRPRSQHVVVHRGVVTDNDRRIRDRIWTTSPARTLVDLASVVDEEDLHAAMEDLLHRGITTPLAIQRCLDSSSGTGRTGSHRLRALLSDRDQAALESRLEVKIWRLLRGAGLRPVPQYEVRIRGAKYRLDFAFPILKVAVEGHGFATHGRRIAHVRDNRRLADLVGAGWRVVPVTWEDVTSNPAGVIQLVGSALLEAA